MPAIVLAALSLALLLPFMASARGLPDFQAVQAGWASSEVRLLDRRGRLLQEIRVDPKVRRTDWTPLEQVSPAFIAALLRAEDRRFFEHAGVDWLAAGKAALTNWLAEKPRGASTLSMQLAALLDSEYRGRAGRRNVAEKWDQMAAARELESRWSKAQILEAYLNLASFRGELVGLDAAARGLFDKRPEGLGREEALILAALIRSPNARPAEVARRVCALAADLPGRPGCESLRALTLNTLSGRYPVLPAASLAPHLAARLIQGEAAALLPPFEKAPFALPMDALESRESQASPLWKSGETGDSPLDVRGAGKHPPRSPLSKGEGNPPTVPASLSTDSANSASGKGARAAAPRATRGNLATTLDADLQRFVVATLKEQLQRLAARNAQDAAALLVDNASGEVLAYASLSGAESASPHSDGVQAPRQAGSTLKPFLYGLALEKRLLTAASPLEDAALSIATHSGAYAPRNYDQIHRGLVSVRTALAGSLNIPAVRVLELTGLEPFAERLARLGFRELTEAADFYGYALALGSLDVRLEELVNAYRALANGGLFGPLRFTPAAAPARSRRVMSPESAFLVADILADRQARAVTFGLENPLATRFWTAVKTGTSKDMRDNWCIGFSSRYTLGVWVGNFSGSPMHDVSGISGAAPAWAAIMDRLHASAADASTSSAPRPPPGLLARPVAPPGEAARKEWFLPGTEPAGTTWAVARPPAQITQPGDGAILALDPDIPTRSQRLSFQARHAPAGAWWQLDGARVEEPDWTPSPGRHVLILTSPEGRALDSVRFEVR